MTRQPFVVRRTTGAQVYLFLNGPFEYPQWIDDLRLATQMPMWKAHQYAAMLTDAQAVPLS